MLASLVEAMSLDHITGSLERALSILRSAACADDAEIFLVEPDSGALLLAACQGLDRPALLSRVHFDPGAGHPGIVTKTRRGLVTRDLARDRRFLRDEVKRQGVRAYVSVPLIAGAAVLGSIHLGWRRSDAELDRVHALLRRAAIPIGTTLRAGIAALRDTALAMDEEPSSARALLPVLASIEQLTTADAVMLVADGVVVSTSTAAECEANLADCPSLRTGTPLLYDGPRTSWPASCRGPAATKARCCVPLVTRKEKRGVITLVHQRATPAPRTQHLAPLMALARAVAPRLPTLPLRASQATPELRIRCFGALEIHCGDRPIPTSKFERRLAVKLLEMLVLAGGAPLHRDVLVESLWPDSAGQGGANRLHGVVHALRVAIEPDARHWRFVRNVGPMYQLDVSDVWVDLFEFRERLARAARHPPGVKSVITDLEAAVALYRGGLFADDPYADWCVDERVALEAQFLCAVTDLAKLLGEARELDRAIDVLRAGLRDDPLREDLHVMLIRNLLEAGRRGEASAQYQECIRVLRRSLGAEPLPETLALEPLIRRALRRPL